ncbi:flagellar basal body rod protein FlgF [Corticimicrobacter populi]|uniref:Flagellar basal-body rod protein FlgF n=1 Tax=Corticimicrobacter populi TaxID=2175229 RepID=A0A2V1K063_9BURK|nr:flagellar basal body rod protein FlgF [Corticimicrobacter populi]PWF21192.1 flagellar biosynthesis protein FlgF [Corticimicrobacter populi]
MDRILFTAAGGAARSLESQAALSNNMANINTPGFRAEIAAYRAVPIVGDGLPTRVATVMTTPGADFSQGVLQTTGRELDVAVAGQGWFAVQTPNGEAYTRAGSFQVGVDGVLRTTQGYPVVSADGGPIDVPERARLTFSTDGTLVALGAGDPPNDVVALGQIKRVNAGPGELVRGDDGLFRPPPGPNGQAAGPLPNDPAIGIVSGALEGSNVNPAAAMVGMINNARRFEMQMKVIQHADGNAQRANGILSPSN